MPSLLADSPGCPISIGKTYQWEDNLVPCKNQSRAMFTKLWEGKKKTHKEKPKTWKPTTGCPCFTHTIIRWHLGFLFLPTVEKLSLSFQRSKQNFKNCESFSKTKTNWKKKPLKIILHEHNLFSERRILQKKNNYQVLRQGRDRPCGQGTLISLWRS